MDRATDFSSFFFTFLTFIFFLTDDSQAWAGGLGRGGEIGIRARLRISWSKDCAGSSPALGTNFLRKRDSKLEERDFNVRR